VSKVQFVRLLASASRATEQGLREGATYRRSRRVEWSLPIPDVRFTHRGRTTAGAIRLSVPGDPVLLARRKSGELFTPLPSWRAGRSVDEHEVDDALARLGRPHASWVRSRGWEARELDEPSRVLLVALPRRAARWSWRARGEMTEWTITGTVPRRFRVTLVLDRRSRVVRLVDSRSGGTSLPLQQERTTWSFRYDPSIAPIELPAPAHWVSDRALLAELGRGDAPVAT
jgi:hypothetical protein